MNEIGRSILLGAETRTQQLAHLAARLLVLVICAIAVVGCNRITHIRIASQTAKGIESRPSKPSRLSIATRSRMTSESANTEKSTELKPRMPIPLPAMQLLTPQPEPDCKPSDTSIDERQKLDYERQCYRHAEMIVRSRLQLLQARSMRRLGQLDAASRPSRRVK
jgi:hypothetical protein